MVNRKPESVKLNEYRRSELAQVDATGEYPPKLKIISEAGETKWLNITAVELEAIIQILTKQNS